jgi:hypothetical protein
MRTTPVQPILYTLRVPRIADRGRSIEMKYLKKDAVPELQRYHLKSMGYLGIVLGIGLILAILAWTFGDSVMPFVFPAFFTLPLFMLGIMFWRTLFVKCPECDLPMNKNEVIQVVEPDKILGRYTYAPWNVFHCKACDKKWRVPAIAIGEGRSISQKEYEKIEQSG